MDKKIRIALVAPTTKWWPYHIYKKLENILPKYGFEVEFINSRRWYIKAHFKRYDCVLSVLPFLFKPLRAKKYYFNPRWNRRLERSKKSLGNKLLYLAEHNLKIADKIILPSMFLADKLWFQKKYSHKITIVPNFMNFDEYHGHIRESLHEKLDIVTVTSFKFYKKWEGILNLWKVVKEAWDRLNKEINWIIIGNDTSENFRQIHKEFQKIEFGPNIHINRKWRADKEWIISELNKNDIFLYRTELDNFPTIILEAMASGLVCLTNNFESFKYFLPPFVISNTEQEMTNQLVNIVENYTKEYSKKWLEYAEKYDEKIIIKDLIAIITKDAG